MARRCGEHQPRDDEERHATAEAIAQPAACHRPCRHGSASHGGQKPYQSGCFQVAEPEVIGADIEEVRVDQLVPEHEGHPRRERPDEDGLRAEAAPESAERGAASRAVPHRVDRRARTPRRR